MALNGNMRLRPDNLVLFILMALLLSAFVLTCSSCKSLEKKCAESFPPTLVSRTMFLSSDTTLPDVKLKTSFPCDELLKKLPQTGEPVIIHENEEGMIKANKGSKGELVLEALTKGKTIKKSKVKESIQSAQRICDCSEKIKAAKWELITNSLTYIAIGVLLLLFILYLIKRK